MKNTILIVLIILAVIALPVFLILKYVKKDKPKNGNGNGDGGTPPPPPAPGKTLRDYVGSTVKATYNGIKLYDNDLNVVATYDAGDKIGWMGNEATGYTCCTNRPGFYKIYDNPNTTGWCECEPIMSKETLKAIFGI